MNNGLGSYQVEIIVAIERSKDGSGANTSDGIIFAYLTCTGNTGGGTQYAPFSGLSRGFIAGNPITCVPSIATGSDGSGSIAVQPWYPYGQYGAMTPGISILFYYGTDLAVDNNYTISVYGSNHTYRALYPYGCSWYNVGYYLMLYE